MLDQLPDATELARRGSRRTAPAAVDAMEHGQSMLGRMGTQENPDAVYIERERIHARTKQPRHDVTPAKIAKRRAEMIDAGQISNLIVEPDKTRPGHFIIIDGELRWRGSEPGNDWAGLPRLKCEVRTGMAAVDAYILAAKANDQTEPLTDYDWCLSVQYLVDEHAMPFTAIDRQFGKGRNWANDRWHTINDAKSIPEDLRNELLDKLKVPGNFGKVHAIATATVSPLKRNELIRAFDSHAVESIRAEIKKWHDERKPAGNSGISVGRGGSGNSSPATGAQGQSGTSGGAGTSGASGATSGAGTGHSEGSAVTLPRELIAQAAELTGRAKAMLSQDEGLWDYTATVNHDLRRIAADLKELQEIYDRGRQDRT